MSEPKITESMEMHLNGGSKFSQLTYRISVDGKQTEIRHVRRTNGRPKYLVTSDQLVCGEDVFDMMGAKWPDVLAWVMAHAGAPDTGRGQQGEEQ